MPLTRTNTPIAGETTLYRIPPSADSDKQSPLLVFIPGNPGFIQFYTHYLSLLHEALTPLVNVEILGISHAGFEPDVTHCNKIYSLDEQINHKIEVLKDILSKSDKPRDVWLFGHSVGAYICQRVVTESPKDSKLRQGLKFLGLITPTIIDIHKSQRGQHMYSLSQYIPNFNAYVAKMTNIIQILPDFIIDRVVQHAMRNSTILDSFSITKSLLTNEYLVKQALGLAALEMNVIQDTREYNHQFMKDFTTTRKWFFFTSPDSWVSDETQQEIQDKFINATENTCVNRDDGIQHSFCIDHSVELCEITLRRLKEVIEGL